MTFPPDGQIATNRADSVRIELPGGADLTGTPVGRELGPIQLLDDAETSVRRGDPGTVILTCANCGAEMIERKCKLICRCGYFLSCSDYY